jgi:ABC-type sugar transport system ATPase subunit
VIALDSVTVTAGDFRLSNLSMAVPAGTCAALMGPTGCGKTTVLEAICGLNRAVAGSIRLMDEDVTTLRPGERGIGYVPQDIALFQSMTVREHLAFGPRIRRWPAADIAARVEALADQLGIASLLDRRPPGLSGGERQRVALGRALASRPPVLCLDEPLSALDEDKRDEMCLLIEELIRSHGVTTLLVTHSRREAERLASLMLRMDDGSIAAESSDA